MESLIQGLIVVISGDSLLYLIAGSLLGMVLGIIPGVSSVVILSVILIFAFEINVTNALCLFLGANCGGFFSPGLSPAPVTTPAPPQPGPPRLGAHPPAP